MERAGKIVGVLELLCSEASASLVSLGDTVDVFDASCYSYVFRGACVSK